MGDATWAVVTLTGTEPAKVMLAVDDERGYLPGELASFSVSVPVQMRADFEPPDGFVLFAYDRDGGYRVIQPGGVVLRREGLRWEPAKDRAVIGDG